MIAATVPVTGTRLLEVYVDHQHLLGGSPAWQRDRITAAREFLRAHPDLDAWMADPLEARLVELQRRRCGTWPFLGFAILTGACRADADRCSPRTSGTAWRGGRLGCSPKTSLG
ncbi:MAG TPA: hypothetical protein VHF25_08655 [Nitriliruptorales bacterium]|nr:hypothetical protein [Nitriliruptorales bacterium]